MSFWSRERLPEIPEGYIEIPPDLAVEVVSPSDHYSRAQKKVRHHLTHGVRLVWVVDPQDRSVTVYRSRQQATILEENDTLSGEDQKVIRQAAKESVPYMRKLWDEREEKSRKIVESAGSQIVTVEKKPFQDAMKPVYDKFITDPGLKDMIRRIQAVN